MCIFNAIFGYLANSYPVNITKLNLETLKLVNTYVNSEDDAIHVIQAALYSDECYECSEPDDMLCFYNVPVLELLSRLDDLGLTETKTYKFLKWLQQEYNAGASCGILYEYEIDFETLKENINEENWRRWFDGDNWSVKGVTLI